MDSLDWVFVAIVVAAALHVIEEHFGGFLERARRVFGLRVTSADFWIVNALFVLLCGAVLFGGEMPWLRMSVAGLIFVNAVLHLLAAVRLRGYSPGMVSGIVLYIPLASYAYWLAVRIGQIRPGSWWIFLLLGVAWHMVPPAVFLSGSRRPFRA